MRFGGATFGILAAAGLLIATSCSDDELQTSVQLEGEEAVISFSIGLDTGAQTRAISDGSGIDMLVYAVYDENGGIITSADRTTEIVPVEITGEDGSSLFDENLTATVDLTLVNGQTYTVVFWAQDASCTAYSYDKYMNVTVDYTTTITEGTESATTGAPNNDETRDAFFAVKTVEVEGSGTETVTLTRPFAQINVGVTEADWNTAVDQVGGISTSSVTIANAGTSINLLTGKVSGTETVTFNSAAIPDEDLKISTSSETTTAYKWLSMSYILVNDGSDTGESGTTLESANFTFTPASGSDVTLNLTSVPVQRNYRTNILGKLLTGTTSFSITLDNGYGSTGTYEYSALVAAAKNGGTVTLTEDEVLDETLSVTADATVDLNGYSITYSNEAASAAKRLTKADGEIQNIIQVENGGKLTFNDSSTEGNGSVGNQGEAYAVYVAAGGALTINGGIYYVQLNCETGGTISITGGTFYYEPDQTFIAENYQCNEITEGETTYYEVVEAEAGGAINVSDAASLAEALATDGAQITLTETIELTEPLSVTGADVTIDLNGYSVTNSLFSVESGASLTIEDVSEEGTGTIGSSFNVYGTLTINGGTFDGDIDNRGATTIINGGTFNNYIVCDGGEIIISGGEFNSNVDCKDGGSITIEDGTFNSPVTCVGGSVTISGGTFNDLVYCTSPGSITISGGTFYNYEPASDLIAKGYQCVKIDDTPTYVVVSEETTVVYDESTLKTAVATAGAQIVLYKDIVLSSDITVTVTGVTIDLNGQSITRSNSDYTYYITANNGANFTITDGSEGATGKFDGYVRAYTGGEATIVGATIRSARCSGGSITIKDGTVDYFVDCSGGKITISGGTFNGNVTNEMDGTITISGGTFYGELVCEGGTIEITGGTFYGSVSFSGADSITIIGGIFYSLPTVDENSISESYYTTQEDSGGTTYYEVNYASGE